MPLAALILADSDGPGGSDGARQALLPIAGQTLIEYQARSAHAVGALHIIVMVDALPGALVAAFDRLRDEGLSIDVARDVHDAADRVHPDEDLLVMASGAIAGREVLSEFTQRQGPSLLTVSDTSAVADRERIDGRDRWAGLALLKGEHLRNTATMIGDWSLGPTLLRVAVQSLATRVPLDGPDDVTIVRDGHQSHALSARLASTGIAKPISMFERLTSPIAAKAAGLAMARLLPFDAVLIVAPVLFAGAITLGWLEFPILGFAVFLIALLAAATGARYGFAAMRRSRLLQWRVAIAQSTLAILMVLAALFAWRDGVGWGTVVLALWTGVNAASIEREARWAPGLGDLGAILLVASAIDAVVAGFALCIVWQLAASLSSRIIARV